jgi:hypothetical protein
MVALALPTGKLPARQRRRFKYPLKAEFGLLVRFLGGLPAFLAGLFFCRRTVLLSHRRSKSSPGLSDYHQHPQGWQENYSGGSVQQTLC